jgi:hypothetical protein
MVCGYETLGAKIVPRILLTAMGGVLKMRLEIICGNEVLGIAKIASKILLTARKWLMTHITRFTITPDILSGDRMGRRASHNGRQLTGCMLLDIIHF